MKRSTEAIIEEQIKRWQVMQTQKAAEKIKVSVITVSREAGSGGMAIAEKIADSLGFDLFHQQIVDGMSESADVSKIWLESLDETGVTTLDEWITSFVNDRHLWPDQYMKHLMKIIGTIGKHGRAVIVGRGANFLLPPETRLRVRIVAPMELRVKNLTERFNVSADEAKRRLIKTESDRRAFVRKYFNEDIADPSNYDIVLNTGTFDIDRAVEVIKTALK
jgi:cytidylate kinase